MDNSYFNIKPKKPSKDSKKSNKSFKEFSIDTSKYKYNETRIKRVIPLKL